jgi:hypothetical protein
MENLGEGPHIPIVKVGVALQLETQKLTEKVVSGLDPLIGFFPFKVNFQKVC